MSIKAMIHVWEHSAATGTDLLVMLALADSANDAGACWPSLRTLAKRARITRRSVIRTLNRLEQMGEIRIESQFRDGMQRTNMYTLPIGGDAHVTRGVTPTSLGGDAHVTGGVTPTSLGGDAHVTGGVTPTSPRTVIEPKENRVGEPSRVGVQQSPSPFEVLKNKNKRGGAK